MGGANGVGDSTTSAVVISLVSIFIADFALSYWFFQGAGDALKTVILISNCWGHILILHQMSEIQSYDGGSYVKERLLALKDKSEVIGDVRGRGLILGLELVTDCQQKTPEKAETMHVMDQMKELGVLIGKGGFYGNVFRITPPMCFTKEDAGGFKFAGSN